jgi:hypothetical protein
LWGSPRGGGWTFWGELVVLLGTGSRRGGVVRCVGFDVVVVAVAVIGAGRVLSLTGGL